MSDAWYPPAAEYWVPKEETAAYPLRYGDLLPAPDGCTDSKGRPWTGSLVLTPNCELGAKARPETQVTVARVREVTVLGKKQHNAVRLGWQERDGRLLVAHSATFWLAPTDAEGPDCFVRFNDCAIVPLGALPERAAAMTHTARAHLIRRELYYRYRWVVPIDRVLELEGARIAGDPQFVGPKPAWTSVE